MGVGKLKMVPASPLKEKVSFRINLLQHEADDGGVGVTPFDMLRHIDLLKVINHDDDVAVGEHQKLMDIGSIADTGPGIDNFIGVIHDGKFPRPANVVAEQAISMGFKIGGDKRQVEIVSVDVEEHIASVKVIQTSEKAIFRSYMILAKDADQQWKLVSDTPWAKFLK